MVGKYSRIQMAENKMQQLASENDNYTVMVTDLPFFSATDQLSSDYQQFNPSFLGEPSHEKLHIGHNRITVRCSGDVSI
jgi:hypothetical protein